MALSDAQIGLLDKLGLPSDFESLDEDGCGDVFDALLDELQMHGLAGNGSELSEYGLLIDSTIVELTKAPNY